MLESRFHLMKFDSKSKNNTWNVPQSKNNLCEFNYKRPWSRLLSRVYTSCFTLKLGSANKYSLCVLSNIVLTPSLYTIMWCHNQTSWEARLFWCKSPLKMKSWKLNESGVHTLLITNIPWNKTNSMKGKIALSSYIPNWMCSLCVVLFVSICLL